MQLRAEITIAAAPHRIWSVLTDLPRYREWNPFLCEVRGELVVGRTLELLLGGSDGYSTRERATLTTLSSERELAFQSVFLLPGLVDTRYRIALVPLAEGTRVQASAEVTGGLQRYTSSRRLTCIARGWVGMNSALERRVMR